MNSSPGITKIAAALVKAQMEMGNAVKDAVNPFFKKSYADLNSVREAALPILNKHGISCIQPTTFINDVPFVETILLHESGEFISSLTMIVVDKINDAQRHGSGLSYARRYALSAIVNIGAEDDDANKAVGAKAPVTASVTTPPPPPATEKAKPVKLTGKKLEELNSAIKALELAEKTTDLTDLKKQLPAYIVQDASFIAAGKARYEVIMAQPA